MELQCATADVRALDVSEAVCSLVLSAAACGCAAAAVYASVSAMPHMALAAGWLRDAASLSGRAGNSGVEGVRACVLVPLRAAGAWSDLVTAA